MRCENCGNTISQVKINEFIHDGSDVERLVNVEEDGFGAVIFETNPNWTGYELSEEEMMERVRCPICKQFPFKHKEVQVYDVVRVVCFKDEFGI